MTHRLNLFALSGIGKATGVLPGILIIDSIGRALRTSELAPSRSHTLK